MKQIKWCFVLPPSITKTNILFIGQRFDMTKHSQERIATAEVTNMINDIKKEFDVEIVIETILDGGFLIKAWRNSQGNRELAAFANRKCIGDSLNDIRKNL